MVAVPSGEAVRGGPEIGHGVGTMDLSHFRDVPKIWCPGVIIDFHMAALARPKDTRPVVQTTGCQPYSLSVGGLVLPVFNPPAFSWWSLSDFRGR